MKYEKVVPAEFLTRPNRFIAKVSIDDVLETVHVKNTGRCKELLLPGAKIGVDSFVKVCDVELFDTIITDWDCVEDQIAAMEEKGVEVIVAEECK